MNGIPVWVWCVLGLSVLYAAAALVVFGMSFGWRRQVADLRRQVEQAELARPHLVATAEQQLEQVDRLIRALVALNLQLVESIITALAGSLLGRLVPALLPRPWRRLGTSLTRQAVRQGAALLAPRLIGAPAAAEVRPERVPGHTERGR